ncbi:MAG: glycosyltransferase [Firmicutes bacterium]|nr:glycosyltransferase [Bacillota bacterium]
MVACIAARNEVKTVRAVLEQAAGCPLLDEVLVLVNGSTDGTGEAARAAACGGAWRPGLGLEVVEVTEPLGHDVGRAVTARLALERNAGVLVFLDADFPVHGQDLTPFVLAVRDGVDVALNQLTPVLAGWASEGPTASARIFLNACLGRPDLGVSSLLSVPHALSRRAVETIGPRNLAVPPLAQTLAVLAGLEVRAVHTVNVVVPNRPGPDRPRSLDPRSMCELILGDHVEALVALAGRRGPRAGLGDFGRWREAAGFTYAARPERD